MNRRRNLLLLLLGLMLASICWFLMTPFQPRPRFERRIAQDLIEKTNSSYLTDLPDRFREHLATFLASPARLQIVLMGDAPPPVGDGSATAQLFLTNSVGARLAIRLKRTEADRFHILSHSLASPTNQ